MTEATVRSSIKTLLDGVSNVGNVIDVDLFARDWDVFLDRAKVTIGSVDQIRTFTIACEAIARTGLVQAGVRSQHNVNNYQYKIRGYQSFDYETTTEKTFLIVVLAVMDALDSGIVSGAIFNAELAQLDTYVPRLFGGVLCHYAEITQVVMEQI